jgi:hypothetical protein
MTPELHMTRTQEKRFYRNAVQACIEAFYGRSRPEAKQLVRDWWTRLSSTQSFETGMFLHSEPMNTAANIAGVPVLAITGKNRTAYHRILEESLDLVRSGTAPSPAQVVKVRVAQQKQLLRIASSSSTRGAALRNLSKREKKHEAAQQQQVVYR